MIFQQMQKIEIDEIVKNEIDEKMKARIDEKLMKINDERIINQKITNEIQKVEIDEMM